MRMIQLMAHYAFPLASLPKAPFRAKVGGLLVAGQESSTDVSDAPKVYPEIIRDPGI